MDGRPVGSSGYWVSSSAQLSDMENIKFGPSLVDDLKRKEQEFKKIIS